LLCRSSPHGDPGEGGKAGWTAQCLVSDPPPPSLPLTLSPNGHGMPVFFWVSVCFTSVSKGGGRQGEARVSRGQVGPAVFSRPCPCLSHRPPPGGLPGLAWTFPVPS
jgi:hypothetical protein